MQESHPPDFRADARLGRFTMLQVVGLLVVSGLLLLTLLVIIVWRPAPLPTATVILVLLAGGGEVVFGLRRRLTRWYDYVLRPRWRRSDASIPLAQDQTVQALLPVQGLSGPFLTWPDSTRVGMVLQVIPAPTVATDELREQSLHVRWAQALHRCVTAGIEVTVYAGVEPDLQRPEIERQRQLAMQWPADSGVRRIILARLQYHEQLAQTGARTVTYHVRLSVDVKGNEALGRLGSTPIEGAKRQLSDVAGEIANELRLIGAQVQYLGPEAVRDVAARQLDPAGWRRREPSRSTDWAWPVGGQQPMLAPPPDWQDEAPEPAPPIMPELEPIPSAAEPAVADPPATDTPAATAPAPKRPRRSAQVRELLAGTGRSATTTAPPPEPVGEPDPPAPEPIPRTSIARPERTTSSVVRPLATREVLAVVGATHRVGTSSFVLNLAYAFRHRGNTVAIVTLDASNTIGGWLGCDAPVSTQHWVQGVSDLWVPGPQGLTLVPGPTRLPGVPYPPLPPDALARVLGTTRREMDVVLLDLGAEITAEGRLALSHATGLLIVMTADPDQAEAAYLRVEQAEAAGLARESMAIIVNRAAEAQVPHGIHPALILPEDPAVPECIRVRTAPILARPDSPWAQAVATWANHIEEGE